MRALEQKVLWWRHAWFFHWAHKPLCSTYSEEVLRVGKLFLCRSCALLWAGAVLSTVVLLVANPALPAHLWGLALAFTIAAVGSFPSFHSRWPRRIRDLLRITAGIALGFALALLLLGQLKAALGTALLIGATYSVYVKLRRDKRLSRCTTCPETGAGICSGYSLQAKAIREWEESVVTRVMVGGFEPKQRS